MDYIKYSRLESSPSLVLAQIGRSRGYQSFLSCICIVLLVTNAISIFMWRQATDSVCLRPKLIESPGVQGIQYQKVRLHRELGENPYAGHPRPEFDEAWATLIEPLAMRITAEELHALGQTSIPLADGSGFLAEMAVYHELHCVKRIRRHLNLEYYYPNMTADEQRREVIHIDHCLEYWREAAMCRADVSLATFQWAEAPPKPFSRVWSDHECVDWEHFDTWARSRMLDITDFSVLSPTESAPFS